MSEDVFQKNKWRFFLAWAAMMALAGCDDKTPYANRPMVAGVPDNMQCIAGHQDHFNDVFVCDHYAMKKAAE